MNKNFIAFSVMMVLLRVLLEVSYVNIISPYFGYSGFITLFTIENYLLSWMVYMTALLFSADRISRVSDCFFLMAVIGVITPICILFGYDADRSFAPLGASIVSLLIIYFVVNTKSITFRRVPIFRNGLGLVVLISSSFVAFLIFWYLASDVSLNLDPMRVYEYRSENQDKAGGGILNYIIPWTYKIFTMTLLAIALLGRRYSLAILILSVQVFFYAASAHKSVLISPLLILGLYFYFRKTNSVLIVPVVLSGVVALTLGMYYIFDDIFASSYVVRRVLFVPSSLTFSYFEFFASNPKVFWSNSLLSGFLDYPYGKDQSMALVIGEFIGYPDQNANNGFISAGFAHAGFFGIFFYSIIIGLILRFLNHVTENLLPLWFGLSLCILPLASLLLASDLLVVLLTHGFIVALFIITLVRSKKYANAS